MSWEWLNLKNWKYFPNDIQERCNTIAGRVARQISNFGIVKKYNGSYSFQFVIKKGSSKTIAKLIPHHLYSGTVIIAAFSITEPKARSYASKFDLRVHEHIVMHEPFFVSKVPEDWNSEQVADVFTEFVLGGETCKQRQEL